MSIENNWTELSGATNTPKSIASEFSMSINCVKLLPDKIKVETREGEGISRTRKTIKTHDKRIHE